jgi:hypothetical protein
MRFVRQHIWWAANCHYGRLLRWMVVRTFNAVPLDSMAERVGMQIEDFRRTFRPLDHSGGPLEGGQDMISLHVL